MMNKKHISQICIALILLTSISFANSSDDEPVKRGKLIIMIKGFASNTGECWFALDNSETVYESGDSVFIGKILPIINEEVLIEIDSLKFGIYAIRVFHDENSNGELDTDFLGIPTEDYGYSNNVNSWFGLPSWKRAKFKLDQKELVDEISLD